MDLFDNKKNIIFTETVSENGRKAKKERGLTERISEIPAVRKTKGPQMDNVVMQFVCMLTEAVGRRASFQHAHWVDKEQGRQRMAEGTPPLGERLGNWTLG